MKEWIEICKEIVEFESNVLETKFKAFITSKELGIGAVLPLFRFLVTGAVMGPSMFEIAVFLGKEECIQRMEEGIKKINMKL